MKFAIIFTTLIGCAAPAIAQESCVSPDNAKQIISDLRGETAFIGLASGGSGIITIYVFPDESWSMTIQTDPNKVCMVTNGEDFLIPSRKPNA